MRTKRIRAFQTGDIVRVAPGGKKAGAIIAGMAIRASGSFDVPTASGIVPGIGSQDCRVPHHADGYSCYDTTQEGRRFLPVHVRGSPRRVL